MKNQKKIPSKIKEKAVKKEDTLMIDVFDTKGQAAGKMELPKVCFAAKINPVLMAQAVRVYLANQRQGTVSAKTRGQVKGSTRKIYRQKGTGRARHGDIKAPIFVGGGVAFGPKMRDLSKKMPKKMKKLALSSALTGKFKEGRIKLISGWEKISGKTKEMAKILSLERNFKVLFVLADNNQTEKVKRAAGNLENVTLIPASLLNTYEVLRHDKLVFMKEAIEILAKRFETGVI